MGVLQGAVGVGAIAGSVACTLLVGSHRMTRWLAIGVALWGMPLAVMGLVPHYVVALAVACVIGVGNAVVDVTAFTLLARMVPDALMARVFGVLESFGALAVALGSLGAPLLIALIGPRPALVVFGVVAPCVGALWWRRLTAIDATVAVRSDAISLLRRVPMLRPLPVPAIERLAQSVRHVGGRCGRHGLRGRRRGRQLLRHRDRHGGRVGRHDPGAHDGSGGGVRRDRADGRHHAHDDGASRRAGRALRDLGRGVPVGHHEHRRVAQRGGRRALGVPLLCAGRRWPTTRTTRPPDSGQLRAGRRGQRVDEGVGPRGGGGRHAGRRTRPGSAGRPA